MRDVRGRAVRACVFDTEIGPCGVAWTRRGIVRLQLPEGGRAATLARTVAGLDGVRVVAEPPVPVVRRTRAALPRGSAGVRGAVRREAPNSPPAQAIRRIRGHLSGSPDDMRSVALDLSGATPFERKVYEAVRRIGPGTTARYGEIARRIGAPGAARAVGAALGRNPVALLVPCHRVVGAGGRIGGFSARGGTALKRKLLRNEGAAIAGLPGPLLPGAARAAVEHLRRVDPVMRRIADRVGPCTLRPLRGGYFEAIVEAIVHQQLTGKAAATIFGRLRSLFPGRGFPRPAEVLGASDAALRSAGLSGRKVRYVKDLAARVSDGRLPLGRLARLDDDRVVEALTAVDGVGRWTAEMFLIFRLGRADVLPVGDYGLRKAVRRAYGLRAPPSPARLREIALRWRPYRSVATWYLWRTAGPVLVGRRGRPAAASPRRLQQRPRHFP